MQMEIGFPGGVAVEAKFGGYTVRTDQPVKAGGEGSAPSPFAVFLASLGTCAGFFALRFCQGRDLSTDGLSVTLETESDPERHRTSKIKLTVHVPDGFPDKYRKALVRAVDQCAVKRHILEPPEFEVEAR